MQNRISLHNRSTVMPCTGRHGSDDACDMVCEPLGKSWETLQLISLHVRALRRDNNSEDISDGGEVVENRVDAHVTFATFDRVLSAY